MGTVKNHQITPEYGLYWPIGGRRDERKSSIDKHLGFQKF